MNAKSRALCAGSLSTMLALLVVPPVDAAEPVASREARAILVTGASTGIGRRITELLAAEGHVVFAGARKSADLEALGKIPNVRPIKLDVTNTSDIAAAVETVTKAGRGLYGLVNNAGVAVTGSFQDTNEEDFDFVMQVNVYGPYRVTRAFAPLIVASKGRITNIGSISGILSGRTFGVYSMSKHAVEAYTDSLALEMEPLGVAVSVIEPGNYNSEIGNSAARRQGIESRLANRARFKEPDEVAEAVQLALFEPKPKRRYLVVPNQMEADMTLRKAAEELVQLNEGHMYTYDRDSLIALLDTSLTNARPRIGSAASGAVAAASAAPSGAAARAPQYLNSGRILPAGLPLSEAVRHGDTVYLSGQLGLVPGSLKLVEGGIEAESRQTL